MKLGIIGLPLSGKSTIFEALTCVRGGDPSQKASRRSDQRIGMVRVMDERVGFLSEMYQPKKTIYAQVEYLLPSQIISGGPSTSENAIWNQVRVCDALIHVIGNFKGDTGIKPTPEKDFQSLDEEMILNDLVVVEKRIERIELDRKRGQGKNNEEYSLLQSCRELLEDGGSIHSNPDIASAPVLKGFTFLSAKPRLVIINNDDEDQALPEFQSIPEKNEMLVVRGRLEMEIAAMSPEERKDFLSEYNIEKSALDRIIKESYAILNLISFFTVGEDEVKAWTIKKDLSALNAAGAIHSDIEKGFIRAETLSFDNLKKYGSFREAKKAGRVRLEGKEYSVQDGDIINFRFNV